MGKKFAETGAVVLILVTAMAATGARAEEFTAEDVALWQAEYMGVVQEGRALWDSADLGINKVACARCHPNAANTHPETHPKFQQQLGRVAALRDMTNWRLMNPLEGAALAPWMH